MECKFSACVSAMDSLVNGRDFIGQMNVGGIFLFIQHIIKIIKAF
jgi:hypothetical protein